jgi:hypothetical protein
MHSESTTSDPKTDNTTLMRELMVNDLRDNGEHEDEEHGD